jgi:HD-GYP domain-containing protein (c-di-GMP phosphodiesterase class II)
MTLGTPGLDVASSCLQLLGERRGRNAVDQIHDVARWTAAVARELSWQADRSERLRVAALVHEAGAVLFTDPSDDAPTRDGVEFVLVMLGDAIDDEQHAWIAHLTERWDGGGPRALRGAQVPEGSRTLLLARTWTRLRSRRGPVHATAECWRRAGGALRPDGVRALTRAVNS